MVALARTRPHPRDLLAAVPDELVTTVGVVGPPDEADRRIREYARHGIDSVVLVPSATDADPAAQRTLRTAAELTVSAGSG